ncbi:MAG: anthranilate synthase component I family protein [Flavobacteriales bacterium]
MKFSTQHKTQLADLITPVSAYLKLRSNFSELLLLESTDYNSAANSKSFICLEPLKTFSLKENELKISTHLTLSACLPVRQEAEGHVSNNLESRIIESQTALSELQKFKESIVHQNSNARTLSHACQQAGGSRSAGVKEKSSFSHGLFGFSTFESTQYFDSHSYDYTKRTNDMPDMHYAFYRFVLVFNHFNNELELLENIPEGEESRLSEIESILNRQDVDVFPFSRNGDTESNLTDEVFKDLVRKGKDHCQRGDVFQVVFSRAFSQKFKGDDFCVYRALRSINPSPYLFYFDYGSFKIFGSSPEAQLVVENGEAGIHPIAGTYRRTGDDIYDRSESEKLKLDPKENAEHVMLVDLARNDLSRNCHSVKVNNYKEIQYFSHVIHLVSKVTGQLKDKETLLRVFGDTFPAGTLSGAPKHKAISLIKEYENQHRTFYGGAIGYMSLDGNTLNKAIVIRSFLSQKNTLHFQAGAGIVIGSNPDSECQEVNNKLAALVSALKLAETV